MTKKRFMRDTAGFALSAYLSRFVQLFRGVIAARILGPAAYGSWNALLLVLDYGLLVQLGLQQGLDQRVPGSLVSDPPAGTERLKRGGIAGMLVLWLVFALAMVVYLVVQPRRLTESWGWAGVMIMVFAVLLQMVIFYHGTLLRSHGRIGTLSTTLAVQAIVGGLAGLALLLPLGAWGLLVGWLLGQVVALVYVRRLAASIAPLALRPNAATLDLLTHGFPIFLFTASSTVLKSVDRVMILKFLSVEALGYYSIGLMGVSMLLYLPESISFVLYPRLLARYSETGDTALTAREMLRPLAVISWVMPLIVGIAVFWVREAVTLLLPQYLPGVRALSVLLFGTLGLALASVPAIYLMAIRRQVQLVPLAILTIGIEVALILLFLRAGATIEGVAVAVSLGAGIYGIGLLVFASLHAASTARDRIGLVLKFALPSLLTVLLCVALFTGLRPRLEPYADGWQISALLCALFVLFYLAMARKLKPRTGVVAMLRDSSWPFARLVAGVWDRD